MGRHGGERTRVNSVAVTDYPKGWSSLQPPLQTGGPSQHPRGAARGQQGRVLAHTADSAPGSLLPRGQWDRSGSLGAREPWGRSPSAATTSEQSFSSPHCKRSQQGRLGSRCFCSRMLRTTSVGCGCLRSLRGLSAEAGAQPSKPSAGSRFPPRGEDGFDGLKARPVPGRSSTSCLPDTVRFAAVEEEGKRDSLLP